jgi:hypothetical protein
MYLHEKATNYHLLFPQQLDVFPLMVQKRTFIDAWILNMIYASLLNVEQYLITNKINIER